MKWNDQQIFCHLSRRSEDTTLTSCVTNHDTSIRHTQLWHLESEYYKYMHCAEHQFSCTRGESFAIAKLDASSAGKLVEAMCMCDCTHSRAVCAHVHQRPFPVPLTNIKIPVQWVGTTVLVNCTVGVLIRADQIWSSALFLTGLGGAPTLVHDSRSTTTNNNTNKKDQGESRNNTVPSITEEHNRKWQTNH